MSHSRAGVGLKQRACHPSAQGSSSCCRLLTRPQGGEKGLLGLQIGLPEGYCSKALEQQRSGCNEAGVL